MKRKSGAQTVTDLGLAPSVGALPAIPGSPGGARSSVSFSSSPRKPTVHPIERGSSLSGASPRSQVVASPRSQGISAASPRSQGIAASPRSSILGSPRRESGLSSPRNGRGRSSAAGSAASLLRRQVGPEFSILRGGANSPPHSPGLPPVDDQERVRARVRLSGVHDDISSAASSPRMSLVGDPDRPSTPTGLPPSLGGSSSRLFPGLSKRASTVKRDHGPISLGQLSGIWWDAEGRMVDVRGSDVLRPGGRTKLEFVSGAGWRLGDARVLEASGSVVRWDGGEVWTAELRPPSDVLRLLCMSTAPPSEADCVREVLTLSGAGPDDKVTAFTIAATPRTVPAAADEALAACICPVAGASDEAAAPDPLLIPAPVVRCNGQCLVTASSLPQVRDLTHHLARLARGKESGDLLTELTSGLSPPAGAPDIHLILHAACKRLEQGEAGARLVKSGIPPLALVAVALCCSEAANIDAGVGWADAPRGRPGRPGDPAWLDLLSYVRERSGEKSRCSAPLAVVARSVRGMLDARSSDERADAVAALRRWQRVAVLMVCLSSEPAPIARRQPPRQPKREQKRSSMPARRRRSSQDESVRQPLAFGCYSVGQPSAAAVSPSRKKSMPLPIPAPDPAPAEEPAPAAVAYFLNVLSDDLQAYRRLVPGSVVHWAVPVFALVVSGDEAVPPAVAASKDSMVVRIDGLRPTLVSGIGLRSDEALVPALSELRVEEVAAEEWGLRLRLCFVRSSAAGCVLMRQLKERALADAKACGDRLAAIATSVAPRQDKRREEDSSTNVVCSVSLSFTGPSADKRAAALLASVPPAVCDGDSRLGIVCGSRAPAVDGPRPALAGQLLRDATVLCSAGKGNPTTKEGSAAHELLKAAERLGARPPFPEPLQQLRAALTEALFDEAEALVRGAERATEAACEELGGLSVGPLDCLTCFLFGIRRAFATSGTREKLNELAELQRSLVERDYVSALSLLQTWDLDDMSTFRPGEWERSVTAFSDEVMRFLSSVPDPPPEWAVRSTELGELAARGDWRAVCSAMLTWEVAALESLSINSGMSVSAELGLRRPFDAMRGQVCEELFKAACTAVDFRSLLLSVTGWGRPLEMLRSARRFHAAWPDRVASIVQSSAQRVFRTALRIAECHPEPSSREWSAAFALLELTAGLGGATRVTPQDRQDLAELAIAAAKSAAAADVRKLADAAPGLLSAGLFAIALCAAHSPRHPAVTGGEVAAALSEAAPGGGDGPPVATACRNGRPLLVALLLDHLSDPLCPDARGRTPLQLAAANKNFGTASEGVVVLKRLAQVSGLSLHERDEALAVAARAGFPLAVKGLTEVGADPGFATPDGTVALMRAAVHKAFETEEGAEALRVLASPAALAAQDSDGDTALHRALRASRLANSRLLCELGSSITARGRLQRTPLHVACEVDAIEHGGEQGAELLRVLQTADTISAPDEKGRIPLHIAAFFRREVMCRSMLEAGADAMATDATGRSPADVAERQSHVELAQMLLSWQRGQRTPRK